VARRKAVKSKGSRAIVVFWLVFAIVIICIAMANAPTIQKNVDLVKKLWSKTPDTEEDNISTEEPIVTVVIDSTQARPAPQPEPRAQTPEPARPATPEPQRPAPQTTQPAQTTQPRPAAPVQPTPAPPVQTRDRAIYYTNVGSDGQILQSRVTRRIPVSESPMQDALNVLLAGPHTDEVGRGILNLIPQNTRLLSASVRGNTAYLSFSEDFLFNTFGVEGYVAQLRQVVWTVTEFQNVRDVQILVEGRRLDYLGEGIWIGSPISRQSF